MDGDGGTALRPGVTQVWRTVRIVSWAVGVISRQLIGSITGHSPQSIDEIMAHYTRTADQAEAALTLRLDIEASPGRKRNAAFPTRKIGHPTAA